jgi:excisionase family DNA binding protein
MDMRLDEVAAFIGKSVAQTRRYMDSGLLPSYKDGKLRRFKRPDVVAFASTHGLRTAETVQLTLEDISPDHERELAAKVEGYTDQYKRQEINRKQYVKAVIAASGTVMKVI